MMSKVNFAFFLIYGTESMYRMLKDKLQFFFLDQLE